MARKATDATFGISGSKLLLVIVEGCCKTAFSVVVHFLGANLELDYLFILGDNGGVDGLIAVLFRHGNVIFDAAIHRHKEGMNEAKDKIAGRNIFNDEAKRDKIIDAVDILVVFSELFMEGIDRFNAAIAAIFDTFHFKEVFDGMLSVLELFIGELETVFSKFLELFVAFRVKIAEASFLNFDTNASHLETVGEWSKDVE